MCGRAGCGNSIALTAMSPGVARCPPAWVDGNPTRTSEAAMCRAARGRRSYPCSAARGMAWIRSRRHHDLDATGVLRSSRLQQPLMLWAGCERVRWRGGRLTGAHRCLGARAGALEMSGAVAAAASGCRPVACSHGCTGVAAGGGRVLLFAQVSAGEHGMSGRQVRGWGAEGGGTP